MCRSLFPSVQISLGDISVAPSWFPATCESQNQLQNESECKIRSFYDLVSIP